MDLPPGEWTPLLVGDQWPSSISLETVLKAAAARREMASTYEHYADLLTTIKESNIAPQEGTTAEDLRGEFNRSIANARHIANVNRVKSTSYLAVDRTVSELRSKLTSLAEDGNSRIDAVNTSKKPLPVKVAEILAILTETRAQALVAAGCCAGEISGAIRDTCLLYTSPSPRDRTRPRMPSSA